MVRRNFIFLASGGVAALAIPSWYYMFGPHYDNLLATPELLSYIWNEQTMKDVGIQYLKKNTEENSEEKLVQLLTENTSSNSFMLGEDLNQHIIEDYKSDRIIMIDGWLLPVTEARQCALFSLNHSI